MTIAGAPVAAWRGPVRSGAFEGVEPIDFSVAPPHALPRVLGAAGDDRLVVLYDRDCGICTATARTLRRWDRHRRLGLLPLQEAAASDRPGIAAAARDLPLSSLLHVVDEATGEVRVGGDAALAIAGALPGGLVVRVLARIPPFRWIVGAAYGLVARHRRRIGRWLRLEGPACDVPR
jgi:predicted DCC family thiol-disulfide oxidoreductase YuxK